MLRTRLIALTIPLTISLFAIAAFQAPQKSHALGLELGAGLSQFGPGTHRTLGYRTAFNFARAGDRSLQWNLAFSHPYHTEGYRQEIIRSSFLIQWSKRFSAFEVFGGLGPGIYFDTVWRDRARMFAPVPAFVMAGGMRMGSDRLGLVLGMEDMSGIFNPLLLPWIIWDHTFFSLGFYVGG